MTDDLIAARAMMSAARLVCPHTDADGLASGALALAAKGRDASAALLLGRGVTPFQEGAIPAPRPVALLDWGVREFHGEALFVDHHAPEAQPREGQLVVSGYGEEPEVSSSILTARIVPAPAAWVAAVGAVGDLGDRAWQLRELDGVPKGVVRKLVPLINAPRRLPDGPIFEALAILIDNPDARSALDDPRTRLLRDAKDEWRSGYQRALRVAPKVADGIAVIEFSSPYQVHPLVAQAWVQRLAGNIVIAANADYLPGKINFAVRGGSGDLRARLRAALPDEQGEFAHGHDRATGGSITPGAFESMVERLRVGA